MQIPLVIIDSVGCGAELSDRPRTSPSPAPRRQTPALRAKQVGATREAPVAPRSVERLRMQQVVHLWKNNANV